MKSDGSQIRSYCYCLDCASRDISGTAKGENNHMPIMYPIQILLLIFKEGRYFDEISGSGIETGTASEEERKGFNPMSNSSLDSEELLALGWNGLFSAKRGFSHTVKILKALI